MWYDNSRLLSYNLLYNFVVGNRGGGKTFNAKKWCINDFLKTGKQFVYVRRVKTEMEDMTSFFADIQKEGLFPDVELKADKKKAYINGEIAGYFIALSVAQRKKSTAYPNVNKIIFDEFVIDEDIGTRYLKNEPQKFLDLFSTIARSRDDVRAVFLSNAITIANPYFIYFGLQLNPERRFNVFRNKEICVEFFKDSDYVNLMKNTRFGKLVSGTEYGAYNIDNEFLRDNNHFITKKTSGAEHIFSIKYLGSIYGLWHDRKEDIFFLTTKYDKTNNVKIAMTPEDMEQGYTDIKLAKTYGIVRTVKDYFGQGMLYFENQEIKNRWYDLYKLM